MTKTIAKLFVIAGIAISAMSSVQAAPVDPQVDAGARCLVNFIWTKTELKKDTPLYAKLDRYVARTKEQLRSRAAASNTPMSTVQARIDMYHDNMAKIQESMEKDPKRRFEFEAKSSNICIDQGWGI